MKKIKFAAFVLCLLAAAGLTQQPEYRSHPGRAAKSETMTGSDAEPEVGKTVFLDPDPSHLSDEDAIRLSRSFIGTPWENPESREGLLLSVETAEGQLYLACLYGRAFFPIWTGMTDFSRPATKVVESCQKALALHPAYPEAYIVLSQGLFVMRRYKDAEAALESAIALRPNSASSYCQLASVLVDQERYGDALAASQQEVRLSIDGGDNGYSGPCSWHSDENDKVRLDRIRFKIEHPNEVWQAPTVVWSPPAAAKPE